MKTRTEVATEKFLSGYNCSQSVLFAFAPELGLDTEAALKLATGFGGGMGRMGETCGAVTGGIMALSLKYGRGASQDKEATEVAYAKTAEFMSAFETRHGSCECRQLLGGCDLRVPEGRTQFKEQNLHGNVCVKCVATAASLVEEILNNPGAQSSLKK